MDKQAMDVLNAMRAVAEKLEVSKKSPPKTNKRSKNKKPYERNAQRVEVREPLAVAGPSDVGIVLAQGLAMESAIGEYENSRRFELRSQLKKDILVHHVLRP